jgi:hypothetical protein
MNVNMTQYGGKICLSYKIEDKWFVELNTVLTKMVKDSDRGTPKEEDTD